MSQDFLAMIGGCIVIIFCNQGVWLLVGVSCNGAFSDTRVHFLRLYCDRSHPEYRLAFCERGYGWSNVFGHAFHARLLTRSAAGVVSCSIFPYAICIIFPAHELR